MIQRKETVYSQKQLIQKLNYQIFSKNAGSHQHEQIHKADPQKAATWNIYTFSKAY